MPKRPLALAASLALALAIPGGATTASADALTVYAAASLREVLPELDGSPRYNFAGSNVLQLQIERGGPADVFLSASPDETQALFRAGRCTRPITFATNTLVLLTPRNRTDIRSVYDLRRGNRRLAVAGAAVPVGAYTRRLLARLRLSSILRTNTISTESNVANVVAKVALGSADAGFTYVTDGRIAADRTRVVTLPRFAQPPVRYQACAVRRAGADTRNTERYLRLIQSTRGRSALRRFGFGLPPRR